MSKTFTQVTELEFDQLLKAEKGWRKESQYNEIVYVFNLASIPEVQIKVFSSLTKLSGTGRGVGKDAIRTAAINSIRGVGLVKSSRINRVPGWEPTTKVPAFALKPLTRK